MNKSWSIGLQRIIITLFFIYSHYTHALEKPMSLASEFKSHILSIPDSFQGQMRAFTWHPGCPVSMHDLSYVELSYWGFDAKPHLGVLIVNKQLAPEVVEIFKILFQHQFPIQQMRPIEEFRGHDLASMRANNTSAFNCRAVTSGSRTFSQHSYGRAIDINPLINPYVKGHFISPKEGALYVDRNAPALGKIIKGDIVYKTFKKFGWDWGGNWYDVQDYQHFEKRANGKKRNPNGYF